MSSHARIVASREYGKKGGVKTDAGKARSCLNALKHGMYSQKFPVMSLEDADKYAAFREEIITGFQPLDKPEQVLVDKIAETMWRIDRYENVQELFIDFEINLQLDELEKHNDGVEIEPDLRLALALHECFSSKSSALVEHGRFTGAKPEPANHTSRLKTGDCPGLSRTVPPFLQFSPIPEETPTDPHSYLATRPRV
jgi:hypothetical protein